LFHQNLPGKLLLPPWEVIQEMDDDPGDFYFFYLIVYAIYNVPHS
jgi:hypothetical protein